MAQNLNPIQNKKDLKTYKLIIAMTIFASIIIALIVGISLVGSYTIQAEATNSILNLVMDKEITDTNKDSVSYGMTFYCEKNKDYNPKEDMPIDAFKYYYLDEDGKRIDLSEGMYFPASYYSDEKDAKKDVVYVCIGFYQTALENLQTVKKVMKIVVAVFSCLMVVAFIYVWYRIWSKREDEKAEMQKKLKESTSKK